MSSVSSVCRAHGKRMNNVYSMRVPTLINFEYFPPKISWSLLITQGTQAFFSVLENVPHFCLTYDAIRSHTLISYAVVWLRFKKVTCLIKTLHTLLNNARVTHWVMNVFCSTYLHVSIDFVLTFSRFSYSVKIYCN